MALYLDQAGLDALWAKIKARNSELETEIGSNTTAINVLNGSGEGSVSKTVADEIAKVIADAPASFDTLKEISDWISNHSDDAAAMNSAIQQNASDISALQDTVGDNSSGLVKDVKDIQDAIGGSGSGIGQDVTNLKEVVGDSNSGLVKRVTDLETTVGDSTSGLVKDVADNASDISNLETVVGDSTSGLVKSVNDNTTAITTAGNAVTAIQNILGDGTTSGLIKHVSDNTDAIATLNGDASTPGSVTYIVNNTIADSVGAIPTSYIENLSFDD